MKPGNLNFPEASGPVQACNGTAALISWKPQGLSRSVQGLLFLYILITTVGRYRCVNLLGGRNCRGSLRLEMPSCLVLDGQHDFILSASHEGSQIYEQPGYQSRCVLVLLTTLS